MSEGSDEELWSLGLSNFGLDVPGLTKQEFLSVSRLLAGGSTVPFIARYRQHILVRLRGTEPLESLVRARTRYESLIKKRRQAVDRLEKKGVLTKELRTQLEETGSEEAIDDILAAFKTSRSCRKTKAEELGLGPLAESIWTKGKVMGHAEWSATMKELVRNGSGLDPKQVTDGVTSILASRIAHEPKIRHEIGEAFWKRGVLKTSLASNNEESAKYKAYDAYSKPVKYVPAHAVLAINRGHAEKCLRVGFDFSEDAPWKILSHLGWNASKGPVGNVMRDSAKEAWDRMMRPSIVRQVKKKLTIAAHEQAIRVFSKNVRELLTARPLDKQQVVVGIDPGFKNGCKVAVVDANGNCLDTEVLHLQQQKKGDGNENNDAQEILERLVKKHKATVVAIGNGTASRETEMLVAKVVQSCEWSVEYCIVNEAGASVYSVSEAASQEFPGMNPLKIGAISIARRLQNSLCELVKYDPSSLGVGMYQKDIPSTSLEQALDAVLESSVSLCGVDVNKASVQLLRRVAGLDLSKATAIRSYIEENGPLKTRQDLTKIPGIGQKTFTEAAGFLWIQDGPEPLDRTTIHPESYKDARRLLEKAFPGKPLADVLKDRQQLEEGLRAIDVSNDQGMEECKQLLLEPWDMRESKPVLAMRSGPLYFEDLEVGQSMQATVMNAVDFGYFCDVGVGIDALLHKSRLPKDQPPLSVGQPVDIIIDTLDRDRNRIGVRLQDAGCSESKDVTSTSSNTHTVRRSANQQPRKRHVQAREYSHTSRGGAQKSGKRKFHSLSAASKSPSKSSSSSSSSSSFKRRKTNHKNSVRSRR